MLKGVVRVALALSDFAVKNDLVVGSSVVGVVALNNSHDVGNRAEARDGVHDVCGPRLRHDLVTAVTVARAEVADLLAQTSLGGGANGRASELVARKQG